MSTLNYRAYDLNLLVVLAAIYDEGSITRAAEKLNLTQPAVSHALSRLRDVFQDPLFTRTGSAMVPTPLARKIADRVRSTLQGLASLTDAADFDPASHKRVFKVALRDVLEAVVLPPLMAELERLGAPIEIHSVRSDRSDVEGELRRGVIDLAVDAFFPVSDEIQQCNVLQDPLLVVARHGHPAVNGQLDLDTYLTQRHVAVSMRRSGPALADVELNRLGHRRQIALRCQHYFAAWRVVSQTNLLLTMPGHYAKVLCAVMPNQLLPFPCRSIGLDAVMYWHSELNDDPALCWLRACLEEILAAQVEVAAVRSTE